MSMKNTKHGDARRGQKTHLYTIWSRMMQRCSDVNSSDYSRYGGRGINVCAEWADYQIFRSWAIDHGYTRDLTIERIDNAGEYSPSNCHWITRALQARNKRTNHTITFQGQTKTLAEWEEITGMSSSLIRYRIKHWPIEKALAEPVRRQI